MDVRVCSRCVMDNYPDKTISFEVDGTCNYCNYALSRMNEVYLPNDEGKKRLDSMIETIKRNGKGKDFDCLMGLSGGLDSTYLAYLGAKKWGLRILAVHVNDGFDTEIANKNIGNLCKRLNIKIILENPDKRQYMDVIKAFIKASVPGIAIPQDNVLLACLNKYSKKYQMKYFLSGANFALESILQRGDGTAAADGTHVKAIHRIFGETPLTNLPLITLFERYIGQKYFSRIKTVRPLDFIDYNRDKAIQELKDQVGFNYYGGKHYESVFTKFVQVYYLPKKFGIDKRKSHFSSMIISGQMTRGEAIELLKEPLYEEKEMEKDIAFILKSINMSREEFKRILEEPGKTHIDYPVSWLVQFSGLAKRFRRVLSD